MMNENEVYLDSILTFAFTNDGKIIVRKDNEGKLDTMPWLFMGYHERGAKIDFDESVWVMNDMDDYKKRISTFFAYHLRNSKQAILKGFFTGNDKNLLDVGTLHKKIAKHQIEEMRTIDTPSFIRVNNELYDGGINQEGRQVVNRVETRYIVLPGDEESANFPDLETKELDELGEEFGMLSYKMVLGTTGDNAEIMKSFVEQLKELSKTSSQTK